MNHPATDAIKTAVSLLESVYGPVNEPKFPLPMPVDEAGPCLDGMQRRYLWTDAFGVLALVSLAEATLEGGKNSSSSSNKEQAESYLRAAHKLIDVVHKALGTPRSQLTEDAMKRDESSPTGYVGLRIGKVSSRQVTDYGMRYDGMYWHYVDKWLLALARAGRVEDGIHLARSCFPYFFDPGDDHHGGGEGRNNKNNGGIRWKLSVDASPAPGLERASANDDTLLALIVFSILENQRNPAMPSLQEEIQLLKKALVGYRPRVTDDPLGWGLEAMYDQFLEGHPRWDALRSVHPRVLHPSHLSLPFRLYGGLIGARVVGEAVAPTSLVDNLVRLSLEHEQNTTGRYEEHSSINRVMLAMCLLCPGALGRRDKDPLLTLGR
jgi:hypothetical protein